MEMLIENFNVVKLFVNPINGKLDQNKIEHDVNQREEPVELVKCRVTGPTTLDHILSSIIYSETLGRSVYQGIAFIATCICKIIAFLVGIESEANGRLLNNKKIKTETH